MLTCLLQRSLLYFFLSLSFHWTQNSSHVPLVTRQRVPLCNTNNIVYGTTLIKYWYNLFKNGVLLEKLKSPIVPNYKCIYLLISLVWEQIIGNSTLSKLYSHGSSFKVVSATAEHQSKWVSNTHPPLAMLKLVTQTSLVTVIIAPLCKHHLYMRPTCWPNICFAD